MDSRERMLAAINHERPDRVPTDIWATAEVWTKLKERFGHDADILSLLHIDGMASVGPKYAGPTLPPVGEGETIDYWGIRTRRMNYGTGAYDEVSYYPLSEARSIADLDRYRWPRADWFDYSEMRSTAEAARRRQVVMCGYMAIFFQHNKLRGLKASLIDPFVRPEFTRYLLERVSEFLYEQHRRMFEACDGLVDVTQVTDDFGTQVGPMISLKVFREFYRPHMESFIDLAHSFGVKVFHHDDGAIRQFIPDLVEMGVDILNPVQWTCPGMELEGLKRDFGRKLCFHGGMDNQRILPFGTPEEVRAEVRRCIDTLASDRTGYILAPCHNLQPITPTENILAMYDEAWKYGRF
ncbi:MAG: uroporphyrinogen decarboxylase family protein [Candidatus Bathyarchaeia archaeon]